ncbi:Phosphate transport system permease protein PstA (TC 3.A.1.7.1) [Patulibacter medicamentivorans]|uniref:Phosphate transport system permease protein PstA (TC 3.A.1.7.1) n=1 Tax=Patulibacter medicamentivorans TaxID=1097667 RepID=H0E2M4_9ACTN|nr:ABC transporter permease subunit [Patulibacter medicamentivorans]EHN12075.1 Phosphate transport system permease protein PstA (TC 3.A.1.7.1) [Patulibacter medicamentivorans]
MSTPTLPARPAGGAGAGAGSGANGPRERLRRLRAELRHWRVTDLIGVAAAWVVGIGLCVVAASILGYMLVQGLRYLSLDLLVTQPEPSLNQTRSGGILDPILGTVIMVIVGTLIALPLAVGAALWVVEFGRPRWLARTVESMIEVIAGSPSIVIAIFGLAIFQLPLMSWMSFTADGGAVFGRSFLTAGAMMSLIAIPSIFTATREALLSIPQHLREASYALGKTRWSTIRAVLLPSVRPGIATGTALGMGRIAGDTAIIVVLLGATLRIEPEGGVPLWGTLTGTGSTLTSYVYNNSPAGEGGAPEKAYAAAFVLLLIVLALNALVSIAGRRDPARTLQK